MSNMADRAHQVIESYKGDTEEELPITAYVGLSVAFLGGFVTVLGLTVRKRKLPIRMETRDMLLIGLATHWLTRVVSRERVTIPLRAPFTRRTKSQRSGDIKEKPRGAGLRRAVGSLVTCPFCMGPWTASVLSVGLIWFPRPARWAMGMFGAVAVSDFLHHIYARVRQH
ncbi:DUF1360 domain-containing protein [Pendulispora brunnea]|uniref:DUF1360 domain-containing protein n=1 Tax=Pendulispora brunnea TaxID=2905690 RepID=A0ABZ2KDL4_9BACT